jgi:predicted methyltransferase
MNKTTIARGLISVLAFTLISGCQQEAAAPATAEPEVAVAESAAPSMSVYEAALTNESRPETDRARDAGRKPAAVLEFIGVQPGMTVLDMFSGSGWYAEIMAHLVGVDGAVIAHSNIAYKNFVGDALEDRFASSRVPQVEILMAENNHLALDENTLDAIMLAQSFHDMYHVDIEGGWELLDGPKFLAELRKGLKPGGLVAVVDHRALAGAPPETGDSLHRIDPALVIASMEAAGFVLDGQSDILQNPDDDLSQSIFSEGIRGKTNRFVMRFTNPE